MCFLQTWLYIFWYSSMLLMKLGIFNISIDSSSLNIFYIHDHTYCKKYKDLMFLLKIWYFSFIRFSISIANIATDFHHFNLFRFYLKYFNIILLFFLYSLGKNKFVYSNNLLPFNMKSINPVQKYSHIIRSYACIL